MKGPDMGFSVANRVKLLVTKLAGNNPFSVPFLSFLSPSSVKMNSSSVMLKGSFCVIFSSARTGFGFAHFFKINSEIFQLIFMNFKPMRSGYSQALESYTAKSTGCVLHSIMLLHTMDGG